MQDEYEIYRIVLNVLTDMDHNDGAMMHWYPTMRPTEQAKKVARRITRELTTGVSKLREGMKVGD